jgi:radical SAM enzyme (TIGR01210 family)
MKKAQILNAPAYTTISPIHMKGKQKHRLMVVYRTRGCEYNACTMCDFKCYASKSISETNIKKQHKQTLEILKAHEFAHLDLLTLGNFYNDKEIAPELREHLLRSVASIRSLKRVLTESRREYVTVEKLKQAKRYLRKDQILEFALGYESCDEGIRNGVLNKGVPEKHLDESLQMCREAGVDFVSYVLIKPHTLTEAEGICDAVNTAVHVLTKAEEYGVKARIAFEPVFVTTGVLEELFMKGEYRPPKLWSVTEVLVETAKRLGMTNTEGKLFIGLSDENLSDERLTSNCGECDEQVRTAIQEFNRHQEVSKLEELDHDCKEEWKDLVRGERE